MIGVMIGSGLRVAEVAALEIGDPLADLEGGHALHALHVRHGTGNKSRSVPIQDDLAALLRAYLESTGRKLGDDGALFLTHRGDAGLKMRGRGTW